MRIITPLLSTLGNYTKRLFHWCSEGIWKKIVLAICLGLLIGYVFNGARWPKFYHYPTVSLTTLDICKTSVN
jgi:Na+/H+-dicarboxylate symporter